MGTTPEASTKVREQGLQIVCPLESSTSAKNKRKCAFKKVIIAEQNMGIRSLPARSDQQLHASSVQRGDWPALQPLSLSRRIHQTYRRIAPGKECKPSGLD